MEKQIKRNYFILINYIKKIQVGVSEKKINQIKTKKINILKQEMKNQKKKLKILLINKKVIINIYFVMLVIPIIQLIIEVNYLLFLEKNLNMKKLNNIKLQEINIIMILLLLILIGMMEKVL